GESPGGGSWPRSSSSRGATCNCIKAPDYFLATQKHQPVDEPRACHRVRVEVLAKPRNVPSRLCHPRRPLTPGAKFCERASASSRLRLSSTNFLVQAAQQSLLQNTCAPVLHRVRPVVWPQLLQRGAGGIASTSRAPGRASPTTPARA